MPPVGKTQQLQIRVTPAQKRAIQRQARRAGMTVSAWILSRLVPTPRQAFQELVAELAVAEVPSLAFAELLEWLGPLGAREFERATAEPPDTALDRYWEAYVASTLEHAAARKGARAPVWARGVGPLPEPAFGSPLPGLRLHLLLRSPAAFARRNIFVDASVGDRV